MTGIDLRKPALAALGAVVLACSVLAAGAQRTEDRIALAVRKPSLTTGVGNAEVTWITGPNVVSYDYTLRLWRHGGGFLIDGEALSAFRWHEHSISGRLFQQQFKEEYEAAVADAGRFSPQALLHFGVRWGIVSSYSLMARMRHRRAD